MALRDGHVRVLPLHVANKIAAGEVVERPASVVKELVENALDAGAKSVRIAIAQGGRKLIDVQDDGCGMTRDDATLALERQATSKILDVDDIESIDTLGFRGEAIPAIASVSRFTLTTRRAESDEGTLLQVNAGTLAEIRAAGCPVGTRIEVRDLFCNVPARRKFLRAYVTEENHVKAVFTTHALAHPAVGFTLVADGRELYRLAPAAEIRDRVRDLFGDDFLAQSLVLSGESPGVKVSGLVERPNLATPTRRDQYVFVNGRPATAPAVAYALREGYPRRHGDVRPAAILFITLPPNQVDVNVHPTKREVRFRDNAAVKTALLNALESAFGNGEVRSVERNGREAPPTDGNRPPVAPRPATDDRPQTTPLHPTPPPFLPADASLRPSPVETPPVPEPTPVEFALEPGDTKTKPWNWFRFLAMTASGYLLVETDAGIVTINPHAARERIAFERLKSAQAGTPPVVQQLLIPETIRLAPPEFARVSAALESIRAMGFQLEAFGADVFKVDALPQILGETSPAAILATIARDLADGAVRRSGERWRDDLVAKSVARTFAGRDLPLTPELATTLVEELAACRMPYVSPRGKPIMIFTSTRELDRKFAK